MCTLPGEHSPQTKSNTYRRFSTAPPIPSRWAATGRSRVTSGTVRESRSPSAARSCRAGRHELCTQHTNKHTRKKTEIVIGYAQDDQHTSTASRSNRARFASHSSAHDRFIRSFDFVTYGCRVISQSLYLSLHFTLFMFVCILYVMAPGFLCVCCVSSVVASSRRRLVQFYMHDESVSTTAKTQSRRQVFLQLQLHANMCICNGIYLSRQLVRQAKQKTKPPRIYLPAQCASQIMIDRYIGGTICSGQSAQRNEPNAAAKTTKITTDASIQLLNIVKGHA